MTKLLNCLCIIQARLGSTRFPNKVLMTVKGVPMVKRVWNAAKGCRLIDKVVVAWPERFPDLDENNVLERFRRISNEFPSKWIIRLTSDCPLLTSDDIEYACKVSNGRDYYSNHIDGHDVQIFKVDYLFDNKVTHKEHVIKDFATQPTGLSVNTRDDLERVRLLANTSR